jgi:hypothetical protein
MKVNTALESKLELQLQRTELISEEQLQVVKELQGESQLSFSEALIELELLSAAELDRILVNLQEVRSVKLEDVQIDLEAVRNVPRRVAVELRCIPIRRSGNTLVVAAADADGNRVRDGLRSVTDYEIVLLVADNDAIEHALFVYYGNDRDSAGNSDSVVMSNGMTQCLWTVHPAWVESFDTFVVHEGVVQASELAKRVASGGHDAFNSPVTFVGSDSSGKSHLLTAIRNYLMSKEPMMKGVLIKGTDLRNMIADYSLAGMLEALSYELRDLSTLLIDDFAGCWGNENAERWIAGTINHLKADGAAVILAVNQEDHLSGPKSSILRETLEAGTVIQMQRPKNDALRGILELRSPSGKWDSMNELAAAGDSESASWNTLRELALTYSGSNSRGGNN